MTHLIIEAAKTNDLVSIKELIKKRVNVNLKDGYGSPLIHAVERGHKEVVLELLKGGADISSQDRHGRSIFEIANASGHPEISDMITAWIKQREFDEIQRWKELMESGLPGMGI